MTSPVCGLRPLRAARLRTEKVPNPTKVTTSPFLRAFVTALVILSTARLAVAFVMSAVEATASIKSALFTVCTPHALLFGDYNDPCVKEDNQYYQRIYTNRPKPLSSKTFSQACPYLDAKLHIVLLNQLSLSMRMDKYRQRGSSGLGMNL